MHSKPPEESPPPSRPTAPVAPSKMDVDEPDATPVDTNLIQLDA